MIYISDNFQNNYLLLYINSLVAHLSMEGSVVHERLPTSVPHLEGDLGLLN